MLGPIMLLKESLTRPKAMVRAPAQQHAVDEACAGLALYQYKTCPFSIKVRQEMHRLALPIAQVDAQYPGTARAELTAAGGGRAKVPCLRITEPGGAVRWLHDSAHINRYLQERFASA